MENKQKFNSRFTARDDTPFLWLQHQREPAVSHRCAAVAALFSVCRQVWAELYDQRRSTHETHSRPLHKHTHHTHSFLFNLRIFRSYSTLGQVPSSRQRASWDCCGGFFIGRMDAHHPGHRFSVANFAKFRSTIYEILQHYYPRISYILRPVGVVVLTDNTSKYTEFTVTCNTKAHYIRPLMTKILSLCQKITIIKKQCKLFSLFQYSKTPVRAGTKFKHKIYSIYKFSPFITNQSVFCFNTDASNLRQSITYLLN